MTPLATGGTWVSILDLSQLPPRWMHFAPRLGGPGGDFEFHVLFVHRGRQKIFHSLPLRVRPSCSPKFDAKRDCQWRIGHVIGYRIATRQRHWPGTAFGAAPRKNIRRGTGDRPNRHNRSNRNRDNGRNSYSAFSFLFHSSFSALDSFLSTRR